MFYPVPAAAAVFFRRTVALVTAFVVLLSVGTVPAAAQELACSVEINRQALTGTDYNFLDGLRDEIDRYVNTRSWTGNVVEDIERIDCSMLITFTRAVSLTQFEAQIAVQSSRPIYGTEQRTVTLLLRDNSWAFTYARGQALIFDPNRFDPFLSVIDFYTYILLGIDHDTFEEFGGTPYYERARRIAELARSNTSAAGWGSDPTDERSRAVLIQDLLDPTFEPLRRVQFAYHFNVLDRFTAQPDQAWVDAAAAVGELYELYQLFNRRRYPTDLFFAAKASELVQLFAEAPQRSQVYAQLSEMDPSRLSQYDALVSGR